MIVVDSYKLTASGNQIPMQVMVERVDRDRVIKHQTHDKAVRDGWCIKGKPCGKFGCRPCCPPTTKLFSDLKQRERVYLVLTRIMLDDYYKVFPNVDASKSRIYFGMDGSHKMTRAVQNAISTTFDGQAFRVGGCLGCQYPKTGKCKRYAPALEATGIDVCALAKDVFDIDIEWGNHKVAMKQMVALGGIYTDEAISKARFLSVIEGVLHGENG